LKFVCLIFFNQLQSLGFIGLGNMGSHMARNLLKAGHPLVVFDLNSAAVDAAKNAGATAVASPKAVAERCDTIITMLPSSPHVLDVYLNSKDAIIHGLRPRTLCIDSSTIDPDTSRQVAAVVDKKNAFMVDAPVSGGVGGAEQATLTFMVGGGAEAFQAAQPILKLMGKNIVHCGASGTGQVAKICNNLILSISMVAVSEGMNLGVKLGMDPGKLAAIINTSSGRCWSSDSYNPCPGVMPNVPSSRGYTGGFGVDLMKKDVGLAVAAAARANANLPMGALSHQLYSLLSAQGYGQRDFSSIYEYLSGKKSQ